MKVILKKKKILRTTANEKKVISAIRLGYCYLTLPHSDTADVLLSQKVPDFYHASTILDDNVDGEMGIHGAHFVPETLQSKTRKRLSFKRKHKKTEHNGWLFSFTAKPKNTL